MGKAKRGRMADDDTRYYKVIRILPTESIVVRERISLKAARRFVREHAGTFRIKRQRWVLD